MDTVLNGYVWIGADGSQQSVQIAQAISILRTFQLQWCETYVYILTDDSALTLDHILNKLDLEG